MVVPSNTKYGSLKINVYYYHALQHFLHIRVLKASKRIVVKDDPDVFFSNSVILR